MKILHIIPSHYPATYWGGPIFSVYHMNNALARIPGVELKVLTTDAAGPGVSDRLTEDEKREPFPYEVIFTRRIAGASVSTELLKYLPVLIRWADVVHLTAFYSFPTIPSLILCRMYGKPLVWSLRGALLYDQNCYLYAPPTILITFLKVIWRKICHWCLSSERVLLHVTSEQEREASEKVYPGARFIVISNGVNVSETLPEREGWVPEGQLRLMYLGRLSSVKGIENLLQAVARVNIPVFLNLYGTGDKEYSNNLVALAKELGILDKKVKFCGHVNGEAKSQAFLNADVCVVPSYSENFCIVVAEALAMGLPVIVSNRLAWDEVEARGCGLVVGNDPESLAVAIEKIREMDLARMGEKGWLWMKEKFTWKRVAKNMFDVYRRL